MITFWIKGQVLQIFLGLVVVANGQLYYSESKATYEEADSYCSSLGTRLVKIDSQHKYDRVVKSMTDNDISTDDVWIGLRSEESTPTIYYYPDGEVASFFVWDVDIKEPNEQLTDFCIRVHRLNHKYRTIKCHYTYNFICDNVEEIKSSKSTSVLALETTTLATNSTLFWNNESSRSNEVNHGIIQTTKHELQDLLTTSQNNKEFATITATKILQFESTVSVNPTNVANNSMVQTTKHQLQDFFTTSLNNEERSSSATTTKESREISSQYGTTLHTITTLLPENATKGYECKKCNCTYVSMSVREFEERLQKIKKSLTLKKSSLSKQTRQKFSAPDKRTSATIVGYVGVTFLAVTFGSIILPDAISLVQFIGRKVKKRKE